MSFPAHLPPLPPLPLGFDRWVYLGVKYASPRAIMVTSYDEGTDPSWDAPAVFQTRGDDHTHYAEAKINHHWLCVCSECVSAADVICICKKPKGKEMKVCWHCFKDRTDTIPYKDFQGTFEEWVQQLPTSSPDTGTGAPADCSHNYQTKMKTSTRGESPLSETPCSVSLVVGRVYRAKKPKGCGFPPICDDRQIKWIGGDQVQYDSPSVKNGRKYPTITLAKFEKWVARDVTDELPDGEWANYPPNAIALAPPTLDSALPKDVPGG